MSILVKNKDIKQSNIHTVAAIMKGNRKLKIGNS